MAKQSLVEHGRTGEVRLQKFLASAGIGSRRHCEEYIRDGRVTVDGEVTRELGTTVDPERQEVRLDGERVRREPKRYYLLNKPPGYVCTNRDPGGRPRAVDLVPDQEKRLFTVGRLDENSHGLLLVTNDGKLANRLAHPRYRVPRKYRVQVVGRPTPEVLRELKRGHRFSDGLFRAQHVRRLRNKGKSTFLEIELMQGRNREIRRLLARVGHKVIDLERIEFGPLKLGRLPTGRSRPLRPGELKALRAFVENGPAPSSKKSKKGKRSKPSGKRDKQRGPDERSRSAKR